mgnify:CR=1 FL=1|tara:strand:+ start:360 stop:545 length:186 start_codon:yes stop_codon:yes gene_type:complete
MEYPIGKKERDLVNWIADAIERKERLLNRIMDENRIILQYESQLDTAQQRPMAQRLHGKED